MSIHSSGVLHRLKCTNNDMLVDLNGGNISSLADDARQISLGELRTTPRALSPKSLSLSFRQTAEGVFLLDSLGKRTTVKSLSLMCGEHHWFTHVNVSIHYTGSWQHILNCVYCGRT